MVIAKFTFYLKSGSEVHIEKTYKSLRGYNEVVESIQMCIDNWEPIIFENVHGVTITYIKGQEVIAFDVQMTIR